MLVAGWWVHIHISRAPLARGTAVSSLGRSPQRGADLLPGGPEYVGVGRRVGTQEQQYNVP